MNEKGAVTPPLTLAGEQTRRSLVLGLWPPAEPAHQLRACPTLSFPPPPQGGEACKEVWQKASLSREKGD